MSGIVKTVNQIGIFDTETNGKPRDYKAPMSRVDNWPRVTQLAWKVYDLSGGELSWGNYLIKPDGWEIPKEEFFIKHGFSTEKSLAEGVPIVEALHSFVGDLQSVEWLFAHNMAFDYNVLGAEMIRAGITSERRPQRICTMERTIEFCKIPFAGRRDNRSWMAQQYKWPKLEELYWRLFGKNFDGAHSAHGDVDATAQCVFELIKLGHISLVTQEDAAKV